MSESKVHDVDHGWRGFFAAVVAARGDRYAKVGVLADTDQGGLHEEGSDLTVAEIAAVLEFGTEDGHIPERSAIRAAFDENRERIHTMVADLLVQILFGKITRDQALNALGASMAAAIKKKIADGIAPPNAPSTVEAKLTARQRGTAQTFGEALAQVGAAAAVKPWIDTGRVLGAITWALLDGKPDGSE